MKQRWTPEQAWEWWNAHPWLVGCNYVPSQSPVLSLWKEDTLEEILPSVRAELALAQSIGFNTVRMWFPFNNWYHEREACLDRIDRILDIFAEYGISIMPVVGNDCVSFGKPEKIEIAKPAPGHGHYDKGYHGGHKNSPHIVPPKDAKGWILWDEEEYRPICEQYLYDLFTRFGKDERIIMWDMWNEPGNSKRGDMSIPYLKRAFEIARECDPIQPLTAGVWTYPDSYGVDPDVDVSPIQRVALDLSDIISFHDYEPFWKVQNIVKKLEEEGRPMANTEWLHRIWDNNLIDQLPLYREKKIASYNWGLVAGFSQHYLPWEWLKAARPDLDYSKWQHDLFHEDHTPYDPEEIELIKKLTGKQ